MRRLIVLGLIGLWWWLSMERVMAQGDFLVACIEEVKQIRKKEGEDWYVKNKTSCLGDGVVGKWSVLKLPEFSKKEVVNDMELEFFAFFDVPVTGPEAREGQMEYQETSEPKSPGLGYRIEKRVEKPSIGDKSLHLIETTYVNIVEGYSLPTTWAGYLDYQELVVVTGECSFMVGGRTKQGSGWSSNHRVDWAREVVINSDHDHGEKVLKERLAEYAGNIVSRVSGVCSSDKVTDWTKGLLEKRETEAEKTEGGPSPDSSGYWKNVEFRQWAEGASNKVNDWIIENLGVSEIKIETMEKKPSSPPVVERITESRLLPGAVIKNYRDGVMVELDNGGWIYIPPKGKVIYASDQWRNYFDILSGEVEVETNGESVEVRTSSATIKPKGTRYWVSFGSNRQLTTVGVYSGEVEVTTRDGKIMTLVPDGDKPGVMMISQKWSPVKLGMVSLVAVGGVGALLLVRKRQRVKKVRRK